MPHTCHSGLETACFLIAAGSSGPVSAVPVQERSPDLHRLPPSHPKTPIPRNRRREFVVSIQPRDVTCGLHLKERWWALSSIPPHCMAELTQWLNEIRELKRLHPLPVVAVFTVVFLEIHPSRDGNERLSRTLATLLFLRTGYAYVPFHRLRV